MIRQAAAALVAVALLAGCIPTSQNPVGDAEKATYDTALTGLWRGQNKEGQPFFVGITSHGEHGVECLFFELKGGRKGTDATRWQGHCAKAGTKKLMSLRPIDGPKKEKKGEKDDDWLICSYEVQGEGLEATLKVGLLKSKAVNEAIKAGTVEGKADDSKIPAPRLTAKPEALEAWLAAGKTEELFDMTLEMKRIDTGAKRAEK